MEEMTEDPVPKRPRSVKSSAEDTPAVMTYEQLQARNIRERKELFRQMGFDKLKDELAARKKKPNKPKKTGPLLPSRRSSRVPSDKKLCRNARTCIICYNTGSLYQYGKQYKDVTLQYTCKFCRIEKTFTKEHLFKKHMKIHNNRIPYLKSEEICDFCFRKWDEPGSKESLSTMPASTKRTRIARFMMTHHCVAVPKEPEDTSDDEV